MEKLLILPLIACLLCLSTCTAKVRQFVLPADPSPECIRQFVKDEYHRDWPKAVLTREGDTPIILRDPSLGAKSEWITPDWLPKCDSNHPASKPNPIAHAVKSAPRYALGGLLRIFLTRRGELQTF